MKNEAWGYEKRAWGYEQRALGYEKRALGYEKRALGYEKRAWGYESLGEVRASLFTSISTLSLAPLSFWCNNSVSAFGGFNSSRRVGLALG